MHKRALTFSLWFLLGFLLAVPHLLSASAPPCEVLLEELCTGKLGVDKCVDLVVKLGAGEDLALSDRVMLFHLKGKDPEGTFAELFESETMKKIEDPFVKPWSLEQFEDVESKFNSAISDMHDKDFNESLAERVRTQFKPLEAPYAKSLESKAEDLFKKIDTSATLTEEYERRIAATKNLSEEIKTKTQLAIKQSFTRRKTLIETLRELYVDGEVRIPGKKVTSRYSEFIDNRKLVRNKEVRDTIVEYVERVALGGATKNVTRIKAGKGVSEITIDHGPGYRIYFGEKEGKMILISGEIKKRQRRDINTAVEAWAAYLESVK